MEQTQPKGINMYDTKTETTTPSLFKEFVIKHKTSFVLGLTAVATIVLAAKASQRAVNNGHESFRDAMSAGDFVIPLSDNKYAILPIMRDSNALE